jgi:hypothetical protein
MHLTACLQVHSAAYLGHKNLLKMTNDTPCACALLAALRQMAVQRRANCCRYGWPAAASAACCSDTQQCDRNRLSHGSPLMPYCDYQLRPLQPLPARPVSHNTCRSWQPACNTVHSSCCRCCCCCCCWRSLRGREPPTTPMRQADSPAHCFLLLLLLLAQPERLRACGTRSSALRAAAAAAGAGAAAAASAA